MTSGVTTISVVAAAIFGTELLSASLFEFRRRFVYPEDIGQVTRAWTSALTSGASYDHQYRIIHPDGTFRWISSKGKFISGLVSYKSLFSGIVQDVTEQVESRQRIERIQAALANEQYKLEAMISQSPAAISLMRGPSFIFERINENWISLVRKRDYLGKSYAEVYPELINTEAYESIKRVYESGIEFSAPEMKLVVQTQTGVFESRYYDYTCVRILDSNENPFGVFCHALNVTERVNSRLELEIAKKDADFANKTKSAFLANMSHEIRTPLGAILGFSELCKDPELPIEERVEYLNTVARNGKGLSLLIDQILDLAKVESQKIELDCAPFDLSALTGEVITLLTLKADEKALILESQIESGPWQIVSDANRIRQILINLIGNAIKFTERGRVSISLRAPGPRSSEGRSRIEFMISDSGIGMTPQQSEKLFEPFVQADSTVAKFFGGTGLGLALLKKLANILSGDVELQESCQGQQIYLFFCRRAPEHGRAG